MQRKNCDPLVPGPDLAVHMERMPAETSAKLTCSALASRTLAYTLQCLTMYYVLWLDYCVLMCAMYPLSTRQL